LSASTAKTFELNYTNPASINAPRRRALPSFSMTSP
jgi:hypothetical protein